MIAYPASNPGFLAVDRGEDLWKLRRKTKKLSLETCDLGLGPGVLESAYARLPHYFPDADRVMDVEASLLRRMREIQDLDTSDIVRRRFSGPGRESDMEALTLFIAEKSTGQRLQAPSAHPREQAAVALGEAMFYRRSGPFDFSCQTCHQVDGARIRLQRLPMLDNPDEARAAVGT